MAAAFRPVNSPLAADMSRDTIMTHSAATPRPSTAPQPRPMSSDDANVPMRGGFDSNASSQKPLPSSPFPDGVQVSGQADRSSIPQRDNSQQSNKSADSMDDSDGENGTVDDGAGSDDESVNADGTRSNKKKKSQRFYCTEYPPCNLSFTRSEHLARHIRKHTGERPFQCHCSRRFSRLDNLRQHAQTVHVNENIPIDSLAATGSRFQRQIRIDRSRQAGNRARASTGGSAGGPVRGHSKSLSTSSIANIGSVAAAYTTTADARRRPPQLVMADPRSRISHDPYRGGAGESNYGPYRGSSPSEFGTPTSATFPTSQNSPRWAPGIGSPAPSHSRSHSMYVPGTRTPGRRLSVPSGANPFQSPQAIHGRVVFGAGPANASNAGAYSPATNNSLASSPTATTTGTWSRRESVSSAADEAWRRRTWHPDSRGFNNGTGSGNGNGNGNPNPNQLNVVASQSAVRPNPPPPIANPTYPQSSMRLPGIESFDTGPHRPLSPSMRASSPMVVDSPHHPPRQNQSHSQNQNLQPSAIDVTPTEDRRNLNMYDASLQRGLNRLEINHNTPPRDTAGAWASEANRAVQAQAEQARSNVPTVRFENPPAYYPTETAVASRALHQHTMSAPSVTLRDSKRHGWYHGPVATHREATQASAPNPRVARVERMVHPNFTGFNGFSLKEQQAQLQQQQSQRQQSQQQQSQQPPIQYQQQHHHHYQQQQQHHQQSQQQQYHQQQQRQEAFANGDPLRRLEALVAVATSEGSTATAR